MAARSGQPCRFFASPNGCRNGAACGFEHVAQPARTRPCRYHAAQPGSCPFGDRCRYLHEGGGGVKVSPAAEAAAKASPATGALNADAVPFSLEGVTASLSALSVAPEPSAATKPAAPVKWEDEPALPSTPSSGPAPASDSATPSTEKRKRGRGFMTDEEAAAQHAKAKASSPKSYASAVGKPASSTPTAAPTTPLGPGRSAERGTRDTAVAGRFIRHALGANGSPSTGP